MKLLFDQNLSFRLVARLTDIFPDSNQVRMLGLDQSTDREIWDHAKSNDFTIVTQDVDFADMSALYGSPPPVVWLRCGNQPTNAIEQLIRSHEEAIKQLESSTTVSCLEIT